MVKYDEIALERAVILEDVAIIDLPKYVPKHIRDSIKKPSGPEWKDKRTINTFGQHQRYCAGDSTPDPGEAPPMAEFSMKSPVAY
jgi:hypothetical protein